MTLQIILKGFLRPLTRSCLLLLRKVLFAFLTSTRAFPSSLTFLDCGVHFALHALALMSSLILEYILSTLFPFSDPPPLSLTLTLSYLTIW